jgi:hypothetical protein
MEKKLSLWQRIMADTPAFFKKAQVLGAGLVTLAVSLSKIGIVPPAISAIATAIGATIATVSQFAVKQTEPNTTDSDKAEPTIQQTANQ